MAILAKKIAKNFVTKPGKALWCKVNNTFDSQKLDNGTVREFSVANVQFNEQDMADMKAQIKAWFEEAKNSPEFEGKKWLGTDDSMCIFEDEAHGKGEYIRSRTNAFYINKDTGEKERHWIPVFDKYGRPLGHDVAIGNGSEIQLRFDVSAYWASKTVNGVNLYLTGVVVKDLVEFGGDDATGFTFEAAPDAADVLDNAAEDEEIPV